MSTKNPGGWVELEMIDLMDDEDERRRMPAKSQRQRRWAFGVKGEKWARAHGYDNKGKLPKSAPKGKKKRKR
jgi:hypothetical protein